jgi:hypothetical protein
MAFIDYYKVLLGSIKRQLKLRLKTYRKMAENTILTESIEQNEKKEKKFKELNEANDIK